VTVSGPRGKPLAGLTWTFSMAPVEARHLFFVIWAATQTYADFDCQVAAVLGRDRLREADYQSATALITKLVLDGCGVARPPRQKAAQ
jgi:TetR/AcrR family transcriptional regulator